MAAAGFMDFARNGLYDTGIAVQGRDICSDVMDRRIGRRPCRAIERTSCVL